MPDALRLLWASVLLNIHRGSRAKPTVVRQLVRAASTPARGRPIAPAASGRGIAVGARPERRAGLAAVAELVERQAQTAPQIECGLSGVEVAVTLCDDLIVIDPASGRAVSRDLHAAAFRRGRHWPSLCFPEAVVLSLPRHLRRGTESTVGLPRRRCRGSSVNDLGPRLEVGPARPPAGSCSLLRECSIHHEPHAGVSGAEHDHGRCRRAWTSPWRRTCRRDRVGYEGTLKHPVRFREAIGALHDVVVSDLRYQPRDKSAYQAYKAEQNRREAEIRRQVASQTEAAILKEAIPDLPEGYIADLEKRYRQAAQALLEGSRRSTRTTLSRHDPELWRLLMPCDPVITVAPDCLFFECFSADESSYGCLTVGREAFDGRARRRARDHERRLFVGAVRALPEAAELPRDAVHD